MNVGAHLYEVVVTAGDDDVGALVQEGNRVHVVLVRPDLERCLHANKIIYENNILNMHDIHKDGQNGSSAWCATKP